MPMSAGNEALYFQFTGLKSKKLLLTTWVAVECRIFNDATNSPNTLTAFSDMTGNAANRVTFINSLRHCMQIYGFDGVSIDWEEPGGDDRGGSPRRPLPQTVVICLYIFSAVPGTWANFSRTVNIPPDIASGNYVLRYEIIALHSAENKDRAQSYPQCINLKIIGSGTATPAGTLGTELYTETDAGIYFNIWNALSSYVIPGAALYTAGNGDSNSSTSTATF
ncbi:glycosyl hydrolase family 61-domain-containing protein [Aspergillus similis]